MKTIVEETVKDFPTINFECDFCETKFTVSPPESDMKTECYVNPITEVGSVEQALLFFPEKFAVIGLEKITEYITHCPICGERVSWSVTKKENINEKNY